MRRERAFWLRHPAAGAALGGVWAGLLAWMVGAGLLVIAIAAVGGAGAVLCSFRYGPVRWLADRDQSSDAD